MGIIIKQGKIWYDNQWFLGDILVEEGIIKEIAQNIVGREFDRIVEAKGKIVVPGLIDCHTHLREPGFENKETILSGAKAALKGGFTAVFAMPNTNPVIDNPELVDFIIKKSNEADYARVYPLGAITLGEAGETIADLKGMKEIGAIGFSDDGKGVQDAALMKEAMLLAKELGLPILAHCEDESLAKNGIFHQGAITDKLQIPGIPAEAEYLQIARDVLLAEITGVHYHVCHVSSKKSVEIIREAKFKGINITAEAAPHHLLLTDMDITEPYSLYKINPPLRNEDDQIALIQGLLDGTIDIIATDHAPHTDEEKQRGISTAPFGAMGLEIAFPLLYTHLVKTEIINLSQLIELISTKPAEIFKLVGGTIDIGLPADLTIIDLDKKKRVDPKDFLSKGKNTPFIGWELIGWPELTIVAGKIKWMEGEKD